jgi:class 3 adenylate cyclase
MGKVIFDFEGTIERFVGDSIMVFFNDPLPCPGHELHARPHSSRKSFKAIFKTQ